MIGMIAVARAGPYDRTADSANDRTADTVNDRTLFIRSLPGYPGTRSDLYEVYMEPYYFVRIYIFFFSSISEFSSIFFVDSDGVFYDVIRNYNV